MKHLAVIAVLLVLAGCCGGPRERFSDPDPDPPMWPVPSVVPDAQDDTTDEDLRSDTWKSRYRD